MGSEALIPRWGACQIFSKRAHLIRQELEQNGRGTFQPTFRRRWFVDGKMSAKESPLMPGYVFVQLTGEPVGDIEGVIRMLPMPIRDDEMHRLVLGHATGAWNALEAGPVVVRKRRRSRPSKRARLRLAVRRSVHGV